MSKKGFGTRMRRLLLQVVVLSLFIPCLAMNFRPPTPAERLRAIGSNRGLPKTIQRVLDPGSDFDGIAIPKPGDWLAVHPEAGRTFDDFVKSRPPKPNGNRNKIYLQPLGEFPESHSPSLEVLKEFAANYFVMDVIVLPPLPMGSRTFTTRINPSTKNCQILTRDVLGLLKGRLPADAFCILAITMEDLYPHPSWNFVYGQASLRERLGVFSFARYDPAFYGNERGRNYRELLLRRSCKVLVHETGHMFSLQHCIFFKCVLNGSNHLHESDSRPLSLCPVCLRKLQFSIGFDFVDRYRGLLGFYRKIGFGDEARWVANRLKGITEENNEISY